MPVPPGAAGNDHVSIDRRREHKSIVVVGMLADQINAPGRPNHEFRLVTIEVVVFALDFENPIRFTASKHGAATLDWFWR